MIDALGNPQTLLILGGGSDIGLAIALRYASVRPLRVVLAGRPSASMDAARDRLTEAGATVHIAPLDARLTAEHEPLIRGLAKEHDIDIAVVAFGILGDQALAQRDPALAAEQAAVNFTGAVSVGIALAGVMREAGHGRIVALSSVAGERPRRSNFVYGAAKAGMDAFYTGLADALHGTGVRVVVVRPGFVRSKMTAHLSPAPLASTPDQVARAVIRAVRGQASRTVWVPGRLRWVMSALRHLPRPVFRRLGL